jgi:hypothetical protein
MHLSCLVIIHEDYYTMESPASLRMTFSFSELMDRTFNIFRSRFDVFITIAAIVVVPVAIVSFALSLTTLGPLQAALQDINRFSNNPTQLQAIIRNQFGPLWLLLLITSLLSFLQFILTIGPMTYVASETFFGRKVGLGEAFSAVSSRYVNLGCGTIIFGLIIVIIMIPVVVLSAIFPLFFLLFGIVFFFLIAGSYLLSPVLVLENIDMGSGIGRAYRLGKFRFWPMVGFFVVLSLLIFILALIVGLIGQFVSQLFFPVSLTNPVQPIGAQILQTAFNIVLSVVTTPLAPIAATVYYIDARARSEGFDLAVETLEKPDPRPSDVPTPQGSGGFLDGKDWRNIAIITGVMLVIGLCIFAFASAFAAFFQNLSSF